MPGTSAMGGAVILPKQCAGMRCTCSYGQQDRQACTRCLGCKMIQCACYTMPAEWLAHQTTLLYGATAWVITQHVAACIHSSRPAPKPRPAPCPSLSTLDQDVLAEAALLTPVQRTVLRQILSTLETNGVWDPADVA